MRLLLFPAQRAVHGASAAEAHRSVVRRVRPQSDGQSHRRCHLQAEDTRAAAAVEAVHPSRSATPTPQRVEGPTASLEPAADEEGERAVCRLAAAIWLREPQTPGGHECRQLVQLRPLPPHHSCVRNGSANER